MMLISTVQQSDSVMHIYIYTIFHVLFHYGLSQDTEYSSLCYTVGPCLSSLYVIVCICSSQLHISPSPCPLGNHTSVLNARESVSVL